MNSDGRRFLAGRIEAEPKRIIRSRQNSLFDLEKRYASLSKNGDPLERLNAIIDWEIFRPLLERMDKKERRSNAGRKPTCRILMFKMLILQRLNGLSDERLQYQVTDRLSFMRFLGVEIAGKVPDARTVWLFVKPSKSTNWQMPVECGQDWMEINKKGGRVLEGQPSILGERSLSACAARVAGTAVAAGVARR
nr:transposase [Rhodoferax sp.]